jgi:cytoskeletal protein RodZ
VATLQTPHLTLLMNRPRVHLGLEATRATLNESICAQVGVALAEGRKARGLSVQEVAGRLLLAPSQVKALETVQPDVFYGPDFYAAALRKYAALVGVDSSLIDRVLVRPEAVPEAATPFRRGRRSASAALAAFPHPRPRVIVAAGIALTALTGWLLASAVRSRPTPKETGDQRPPARMTPPPPAPMEPFMPSPSGSAEPAEPALDAAAPSTTSGPTAVPAASRQAAPPADGSVGPDDAIGRVRVGKRTWIFVRYVDNSTVERGLAPGEEFILEDRPIYLAVGVAEDTDVEIGGHTIDNSLFTTNGQLRVGSSQLARLAPARQ